MKTYLLNIAIAVDQMANAVLRGAPDETLSSRAHRMQLKGHRYWGWTATAINLLFFWEADHCRAAHESEQRRTQLPRSFK